MIHHTFGIGISRRVIAACFGVAEARARRSGEVAHAAGSSALQREHAAPSRKRSG
jgi:hypothetical protein